MRSGPIYCESKVELWSSQLITFKLHGVPSFSSTSLPTPRKAQHTLLQPPPSPPFPPASFAPALQHDNIIEVPHRHSQKSHTYVDIPLQNLWDIY